MTRRQELEDHRAGLVEIREIMNSMKTLAYLETHKLQSILQAQRNVIENIETVTQDFLSFYPGILPQSNGGDEIVVVIGSERGFCGDFNQVLARQLRTEFKDQQSTRGHVIAVGHKLHALLENTFDSIYFVEGANTIEEGVAVLNEVVDLLSTLQEGKDTVNVSVLYHGDQDSAVMQALLPPFQHLLDAPNQPSEPPLLHMPPDVFLSELTDHYLFAALQEIVSASLMAENRRRVQHMEGAVSHLDDMSTEILHQCHALRQEEITEEIEVILLSAANLDGITRKKD